MSVLPIREMGDPVLREVARPVAGEELAGEEVQRLIDDMIETMRARTGPASRRRRSACRCGSR